MIHFDPAALTAPVAAIAETARTDGQSPAALIAVTSGALSVQLAAGVADLETLAPAQPGQTF